MLGKKKNEQVGEPADPSGKALPSTWLRWTRNFGSSALLVKVTKNHRRQSRHRSMMAFRRTGSIPNFA